MIATARHFLASRSDVLMREAIGLAALCVAILSALFLPVLA